MFGIGMPELLVLFAVALIVFGPKKLPELGKSIGKAMREFKKATTGVKDAMNIDDELTDEIKSVQKGFNTVKNGVDVKSIVTDHLNPLSDKNTSDTPEKVAVAADNGHSPDNILSPDTVGIPVDDAVKRASDAYEADQK